MKRGLVPLLLTLFLAFVPIAQAQEATPSAAGTVDMSTFEAVPNDCSFLNAAGAEILDDSAGDISCGTVQVPEDWSNPEGRQLEISFVVLESHSDDPAPDPILYLSGGPGESALAGLGSYVQYFDQLRQDRDVILFDQRGTSFSSPLICSAFALEGYVEQSQTSDSETDDAGDDDSDDSDAEVSTDPDVLLDQARAQVSDQVRRCVQDLNAQGVDLRQYNSVASGNDVMALLTALGVDEYNIYGISYGTRLALSIMRDHPNSGIRSVVLDSTFPPEIQGFEQYPVEAEEVVLQVFATCALDPACNAAYPNLKERFKALLDRLKEEPVMTSTGDEFTADDLIEFVKLVGAQAEVGSYIPIVISQLEAGDTTAVEALAASGLGQSEGDETADESADEDMESGEGATPAAVEAPATPEALPTPVPGADEAATFIAAIHDTAVNASISDKAELLYLMALLDKGPHTADALRTFVYHAFANDPDVRAQLVGLIDTLTPDGIDQVFVEIAQIDSLLDLLSQGMSSELFNSVECHEEIPFEQFENTVQNWQNLEIPELAAAEVQTIAQQFATCELWPSGRASTVEMLPVSSVIPTLIFSGGYDFQTPPTWNKDAFLYLPNATFVSFPATNHGVIAYQTECASAIADAFMNDPSTVPDIGCTLALKPAWVLPDGTWTNEA